MGQFVLRQENSRELQKFAHIDEFALKKNNSISLNSFNERCSEYLRFFYILDGKFDWVINNENYTLYPTDLAMILPGQELSAEKGYLDIGTLYRLNLSINTQNTGSKSSIGRWSNISPLEFISIKKILFFWSF